ncbi:TspO/MBR family protein [uncultured Aliiroseovarius sp.]|uniref:TspO/MBR family protein n=1 Tax=uncultured Aliiroseovarius sp. TaxID=1658783 RepID=UPI0026191B7E|nr:TspO/MBR family protein [uncultured Aliiroseovarius sp.]
MKNISSLLLFLILVMGGGIAIGTLTAPGEWYQNLQKPFFNPPNWVFGPVWTVLYLAIAYVGWRVWQHEHHAALRRLWIIQIALNFSWSPIFFAAQQPALALGIILFLFLTIAIFMRAAWRLDRPSALLFTPYIAWVGFASALNAAIVLLN